MCIIYNEMQFSISASEIMAEFWIISASFGHFIDKKFKFERNQDLDTIYDLHSSQRKILTKILQICTISNGETLQLLYRADFQNFLNSWVITFQRSVNTLLLPKYTYLVHFPLLWGSAFKNVSDFIALPH